MTRRLAVGLGLLVWLLVSSATPAAAHGGPGGGDPPATNYRTRILEVDPAVDGIEVRVIEAGARLEIVNRTGRRATVLGYEGEPYLRVGPDGVFENTRSPATYLNQDRYAQTKIPAEADAKADPVWRRVGDGPSAQWHDHRSHWMGGTDPPVVQASPGEEQVVVPEWEVPIEVGTQTISVSGDLTWVPGPSPYPWYLAAIVLAVALGALGWFRSSLLPVVVWVASFVAAGAVDVAGAWSTTAQPGVTKLNAASTPVVLGVCALAVLCLSRRAPRESVAMLGLIGLLTALVLGFSSLDWLGASQLPTPIEPWLARTSVAVSLGAGIGVAAFAAAHYLATRPATAGARAAPATEPTEPLFPPWVRRQRWVLLGGFAVLFVATYAVGQARSSDPVPAAVGGGLHSRLCTAVASASAGKTGDAADLWSAQIHGPLHTLAADAAEEDRAVAARLLEAKQAVEQTLGTDRTTLASDLSRLAPRVRAALVVTGNPEPDPCPEERP